ncbi:hypothetical protein BH20ACT16_BH20ACT16_14740 [soil metagenome]
MGSSPWQGRSRRKRIGDPTAFPAVCFDALTFAPGAVVPGGTGIGPGDSFSFTAGSLD